jgi:hypothetical protein
LALAVWLKSYRRLGYFPKLEDVPDVVVGHVRDTLKVSVDVVRGFRSPREIFNGYAGSSIRIRLTALRRASYSG